MKRQLGGSDKLTKIKWVRRGKVKKIQDFQVKKPIFCRRFSFLLSRQGYNNDSSQTRTHWIENLCIRSLSGLYFPQLGLNMNIYYPRIQAECGKIRTRKTANWDTFYTVHCFYMMGALANQYFVFSCFIWFLKQNDTKKYFQIKALLPFFVSW